MPGPLLTSREAEITVHGQALSSRGSHGILAEYKVCIAILGTSTPSLRLSSSQEWGRQLMVTTQDFLL